MMRLVSMEPETDAYRRRIAREVRVERIRYVLKAAATYAVWVAFVATVAYMVAH